MGEARVARFHVLTLGKGIALTKVPGLAVQISRRTGLFANVAAVVVGAVTAVWQVKARPAVATRNICFAPDSEVFICQRS